MDISVSKDAIKDISLDVVKAIAHKLKDPIVVKNIVLDPENINPNSTFQFPFWDDLSLAAGFPSLLLFFAELDDLYPEENWDQISHQYVLKIKESIERQGVSSHGFSLFSGLTGICFAIQRASRKGTRYQKLLQILQTRLIEGFRKTHLEPLNESLKHSKPCHPSQYELIQGISGIGLYSLYNKNLDSFYLMTKEILRLLVALCRPITIEGHTVPGWYLPNEFLFNKFDKQAFPKGNFNLGLSHGIPGVLTLLSLALLQGIEVEGQKEAIELIVSWIQSKRKNNNGMVYWGHCIKFEDEIKKNESNSENRSHTQNREAWCYGTPGVAQSIFLSGKALNNQELQQYAIDSLISIFQRPSHEWLLPGPTLCHGISGLFAITNYLAKAAGSHILNEKAQDLYENVLEHYHPDYPLGFKDYDPGKQGEYVQIERAGLLEGTSGVLLALLSANNPILSLYLPFGMETEIAIN